MRAASQAWAALLNGRPARVAIARVALGLAALAVLHIGVCAFLLLEPTR